MVFKAQESHYSLSLSFPLSLPLSLFLLSLSIPQCVSLFLSLPSILPFLFFCAEVWLLRFQNFIHFNLWEVFYFLLLIRFYSCVFALLFPVLFLLISTSIYFKILLCWWIWWKYYVCMYENGKMIPLETFPWMGGEG
jgi:hypothetical protein